VFSALLNGADREKLLRFCTLVGAGTGAENKESAAIRLRDYLVTHSDVSSWNGRKQIFLRSQRALKAFLDGHGINKLYAPEIPIWTCDFLFPEGEKQEAA
jgi:hypothetical protein